jgi:hypothetical protein
MVDANPYNQKAKIAIFKNSRPTKISTKSDKKFIIKIKALKLFVFNFYCSKEFFLLFSNYPKSIYVIFHQDTSKYLIM